ncbi:MAG: DUF4136 domain-containing protein [Gammaproteobacteria bacterium]|nr:DUF4136 domain-containing protein [Gammaproteobacteria bacterium]MDH5170777.1 DUF4136 domain-containing protein [Gammaproteobacteria bacterium]
MRIITTLATLLLTLAVVACSGIETRPAPIDSFAAGNYKYYRWRSDPLPNTANSQDPMYIMDPILRRAVDAELGKKGYVLDNERAQFSVDYIYASGLRMGERSAEAYNITPYPSVNPNQQVNQAVVDNAYALGGVKETSNIGLQFNDATTKKEVWHVIITKIVENVNKVDKQEMRSSIQEGVHDALKTLPPAK